MKGNGGGNGKKGIKNDGKRGEGIKVKIKNEKRIKGGEWRRKEREKGKKALAQVMQIGQNCEFIYEL
jgi:hypothetical protein